MKTCVYYDSCGEGQNGFFEVEGDLSHLDGCYVNHVNCTQEQTHAVLALCFNEEGDFTQALTCAPSKDWDFFITVGFLP